MELKEEQDKMLKLRTHDFLGKNLFCDEGFQNMFSYQLTLNTLEFNKDKGTNYLICWNSKGVHTSKLNPLYTAFLNTIKHSRHDMEIKFDKDNLAVEQNNYATKIVMLTLFMV